LEDVTEYLEGGMAKLRQKPQSIQEMGEAKGEWKIIAAQKKEKQRDMVSSPN
jgi:hypothetical protein